MTDHEIVVETETMRVRVVSDYYPEPPYNEGGSPLLQLDGRRGRAQQVTEITTYNVSQDIIDAASHFADNPDAFERYLRIFHGTTSVVWYGPNRASDYGYVTFDTADWRASLGLTDEYLAEHPDITLADLTEWTAYVEGDVYMVVIEDAVTWTSEHGETRTEWETRDSCGGFYGYEYAVEEAKSWAA